MTNNNTESAGSIKFDENVKGSARDSNERIPLWDDKLNPELDWMIEMHAKGGLEALDRENSWIPIDTVAKQIGWDSRIVLHFLRQHRLITGEKTWHPKLLEYGLICVISYTESCGLSGYEGKVELTLLSERGKSFLKDFLENYPR
jgi:hypothetical protein